jgi:hypothetical protein
MRSVSAMTHHDLLPIAVDDMGIGKSHVWLSGETFLLDALCVGGSMHAGDFLPDIPTGGGVVIVTGTGEQYRLSSSAMYDAVKRAITALYEPSNQDNDQPRSVFHDPLRRRVDLSWINLAQSGHDAPSEEVLERIIDGLTDTLRAGRYDLVDAAFREVNPAEMSLEAMMAFLRIPFMVRAELEEWKTFLGAVRNEGKRRGVSSPHFLKGLV